MEGVYSYTAHMRAIKNQCFRRPSWFTGYESACKCRGHGFEPCFRKPQDSKPYLMQTLKPSRHNYWSPHTTAPVLYKRIHRNKELVQFSSVTQSCLTLCDSMPGLPVHHQLPGFTQTHVHWVCDAIQPSHPLSSPSPTALNLSKHQGLFKWVSSSHQEAKVLEFQLQHQSFQWTLSTDLL